MTSAQNTTYPVGVIHGRFQILHLDHLRYLMAGKELCDHLVVGVTNPDPSHTGEESSDPVRSSSLANPLTYFERQRMIRDVLMAHGVADRDLTVCPLPINFPELYRFYVPMEAPFFLTIYDDWGRAKLARFRELGLTPHILWERPQEEKGIQGRDVRDRMLHGQDWKHLVPEETAALCRQWNIPGRLHRMARENTGD